MFLGEILVGIDLEGDEPGEDSKCIANSVWGGSSLYIHNRGQFRPSSVCFGYAFDFRVTTVLVWRASGPRRGRER